jgi:ClpP class serine protease
MQKRVDEYYDAFVEAVAQGRNVRTAQVRNGMGQGRVLGPRDALAEKMVDGITTLQQLVRDMTKSPRPRDGVRHAAWAGRQREIELLSL